MDAAISLAITAFVFLCAGVWLGVSASNANRSFWQYYARVAAIVVGVAIIALGWTVSHSSAKWWESPAAMALIAAIIGAVPPLSSFVSSWAKLQQDDAKQSHDIVSGYLERALNPEATYATRMQLLRFLATDASGGRQLERWAKLELARVAHEMKNYNQQIEKAERQRAAAKTAEEYAVADAELSRARARMLSASDVPKRPPITAQALRAGFFSYEDLGPQKLVGESLEGMEIQGCKLSNSDFSRADLRRAAFTDAEVRTSTFDGANLEESRFNGADLRGSTFVSANLRSARLNQAHVEGVDFTGADFGACNEYRGATEVLGACYDRETKWPEGFDPEKGGCILIPSEESSQQIPAA